MAAGAVSSVSVPQHDVRWKWLLLAGCALMFVWTIATVIDNFGWFSRPWYGYWDASVGASGQPWMRTARYPRRDGAMAKAGIVDGDRFDLREQTLDARVRLYDQPVTTQPVTLVVRRGAATFTVHVSASSAWDSATVWKTLLVLPDLVSAMWFLACTVLIAIRRSASFEGRALGLTLLCLCAQPMSPQAIVVPDPIVTLLFFAAVQTCGLLALLLIVGLSSQFGTRSSWRRTLEWIAYAAIALSAILYGAAYYGILTLRIDPEPIAWRNSGGFAVSQIPTIALVIAVAATAVASSPRSERARAAWLLLPLPIAIAVAITGNLGGFLGRSWFALVGLEVAAGIAMLLGALAITYALLKRRVLDLEFVLNRTLVVATLSLIVVAAFVLLEWLLGTSLAGASHATGLIANGALALVLGLSMNFIHKRVDTFIDLVFFRKRHEDERALLDFSKEAAYVTESNALLDQAIENIERHTDARGAALLLERNGTYAAARSFGDVPLVIGENDAGILALKTWRKPLDPHHHPTALVGALALPMLARGRLLGVLLLGERTGGEAYAPDEVEALSQFAHGVGSALEALALKTDGAAALLGERIEVAIATMGEMIAEIRTLRTSLPT
jgi:GAF domain